MMLYAIIVVFCSVRGDELIGAKSVPLPPIWENIKNDMGHWQR